jgi:hypothetical protein
MATGLEKPFVIIPCKEFPSPPVQWPYYYDVL